MLVRPQDSLPYDCRKDGTLMRRVNMNQLDEYDLFTLNLEDPNTPCKDCDCDDPGNCPKENEQ